MAQNNVSELNTSAASNTDFGGIGILGTNLVSTADDAFRANSAIIAKWWSDIGAVNTVAGTANAITVTTPTLYAAFKQGVVVGFKNTAGPNTGAVTLNLDALGAKAIRLQGDTALVGGEMVANGIYLLRYDTSYNSAAGAWVLLNSALTSVPLSLSQAAAGTILTLTSTNAGAGSGPDIDLYRNSASPAVSDLLSKILWNANNSGAAKTLYASLIPAIVDPTAGTEDAGLIGSVVMNGAVTDVLYIGLNASGNAAPTIGLPLGQLSFPATQNPSSNANTLDDYEEGTATPAFVASGATFSYNNRSIDYTKVGRSICYDVFLQLNTSGNTLTANPVTVSGLPFTIGGGGAVAIAWSGATTSYVNVVATPTFAATSFVMSGITAAATGNEGAINANALLAGASGSNVNFGGNYTT